MIYLIYYLPANIWGNFFFSDTSENWVQELEEDVKAECEEKYGKVLHLHVDASSREGEIYVKFDSLESGEKAIEGLNGRFFAGRQIHANPMVEMVYQLR
jgi:RNA-binding protein 39